MGKETKILRTGRKVRNVTIHCMSPEPGDQEWPLLMKRITHCQIKSCSVHQKYTNAAALELLDPRQPEIQPMVFLIQMSGELIRIKTDIWRPLALLYFSHIEISGNRLKYYQPHKWFKDLKYQEKWKPSPEFETSMVTGSKMTCSTFLLHVISH